MQCFGMARAGRDMGFDYAEDKEIITVYQGGVVKAAFEAGEAFADQRGFDLAGLSGREAEGFEFIGFAAVAIADADDCVDHLCGRDIDDAFPAAPDHLKAVIR